VPEAARIERPRTSPEASSLAAERGVARPRCRRMTRCRHWTAAATAAHPLENRCRIAGAKHRPGRTCPAVAHRLHEEACLVRAWRCIPAPGSIASPSRRRERRSCCSFSAGWSQHRLGPGGSGLAALVRAGLPAHGRGRALRARSPARRDRRRLPHRRARAVDGGRRCAGQRACARAPRAARRRAAGPPRRDHRPLQATARRVGNARLPRADVLLPHGDARARHQPRVVGARPRRSPAALGVLAGSPPEPSSASSCSAR